MLRRHTPSRTDSTPPVPCGRRSRSDLRAERPLSGDRRGAFSLRGEESRRAPFATGPAASGIRSTSPGRNSSALADSKVPDESAGPYSSRARSASSRVPWISRDLRRRRPVSGSRGASTSIRHTPALTSITPPVPRRRRVVSSARGTFAVTPTGLFVVSKSLRPDAPDTPPTVLRRVVDRCRRSPISNTDSNAPVYQRESGALDGPLTCISLERTTGFEPATLTLASRYWRKLANASDR